MRRIALWMFLACVLCCCGAGSAATAPAGEALRGRPNILLILADDLGYSDLGCYGSGVRTPNLDRLAAEGVRFSQFYNAARCCPTRASLLTGLYPHQAGVGHMLQNWHPPSYTSGIGEDTATLAEALRTGGYSSYHVGKWHVGGVGAAVGRNHPLNRGFAHAYGTGGGGNYFAPQPLYRDREAVRPEGDYYVTDAFSEWAARYLRDHRTSAPDRPFFLNLCYTAPHFPLHARTEDINRYLGTFRRGWDHERAVRFARQRQLGLVRPEWTLSHRDPVAQPWSKIRDETAIAEWDRRMAVHAAMIDRMDQGIGHVLSALRETGQEKNTLVLFLSDNGASAEALDSWPNPARGHRPGAVVGAADSHRCLEIGWANAANTPFRENKMWVHEGGISTPLIAHWPGHVRNPGSVVGSVGHIIDLMPTFLDAAGLGYPAMLGGRSLRPLEGTSLLPALRGRSLGPRRLGWEHEGNRAYRDGDWKVVATHRGHWELYDLAADRTETQDLATRMPERTREMAAAWQKWAERVGVVPWETLPGSSYRPAPGYRRKSEPPLSTAAPM